MSNPLTILLVHNHYQQRGGEDSVFETECAMLRGAGHTVICYEKHNDEIGSGEKRLAASGQRLESEEAKGSGFRVQEGKASSRALSQALSNQEKGLAAIGQRLGGEEGLAASGQGLARQDDRNDSPAPPLEPSTYHLAPFRAFRVFRSSLSLFVRTIWNRTTYREITVLIREHRPDVVHCHNTFPLISPSVYWAAAKQGVPVVQTLHNYRLVCINPYLYRNGRICEDCLGRSPLRGVIHRCYRGSFAASFTVTAMLMAHRLLGTYRNKVTTYIALTEFGRKKFLEARLCDPAKVVVKPNAVAAVAATAQGSGFRVQDQQPERPDNRNAPPSSERGPKANNLTPNAPAILYVGRLSPEKGVDILIAAWKLFLEQRSTASGQRLVTGEATSPTKPTSSTPPASRAVGNSCQTPTPPHTQTPAPPHSHTHTLFPLNPEPSPPPPAAVRLVIIGDGPERAALEAIAKELPSVTFTGRLSSIDLHAHMATASVLVLPSTCYETFAMAVNEAAALGTPAIVSDIGGQASLVEDGATGFTFRSGSAESLAETLAKALADPDRLAEIGRQAQERFHAGDCPPERNVAALCLTYAHAVGIRR